MDLSWILDRVQVFFQSNLVFRHKQWVVLKGVLGWLHRALSESSTNTESFIPMLYWNALGNTERGKIEFLLDQTSTLMLTFYVFRKMTNLTEQLVRKCILLLGLSFMVDFFILKKNPSLTQDLIGMNCCA